MAITLLANSTSTATTVLSTTTKAANASVLAARSGLLIPADQDTTATYVYYAILSVLIIVFSVICIFGNSLVLAAIIKFPSIRDGMAVAIATLSMVDACFAVGMAYSVIYTKHWPHSRFSCQAAFFLSVYFGCLSNSLISYMSVERAVAVMAPFFYQNRVTVRLRVGIISAVAIVYFIVDVVLVYFTPTWHTLRPCGPSSFHPTLYLALVTLQIIFNLLITIAANCLILFGIHRQNTAMSKSDEQTKKNWEREKQIAKTAMTVVGVYLVTYLPYVIIGITVSEYATTVSIPSLRRLLIVVNFCYLLLLLNSSLNPFIYARKNKKYRDAMKALLCAAIKKHSSNSVSDESQVL